MRASPAAIEVCDLPLRTEAFATASRFVARQAVRSLYAELALYPKPGLVSLRDSGAHRDMDARTFFRSLFALRRYFAEIALAGARSAAFDELRALGVAAEMRMMCATGGINTHRGAIFMVGLLAASAGAVLAQRETIEHGALRAIARTRWARDLSEHASARRPWSHGREVAARYGAAGALGEAMLGFPSVFEVGLPALRESLARGASAEDAQLHVLFALMALVDDTNVLYRGGEAGLRRVQRSARAFLASGSVSAPGSRARAESLHRAFSREGLSPGGSADLLAATWFVHRLETSAR
jgi:triphosphoribosyl-dephospho-CoA synthase